MHIARLGVIGLIAAVVLVGLGYAWGAAGRGTAEQGLEEIRERFDAAEARGHLLDARVSLYNNNFGDASRRLEEAKEPLRRMRLRYEERGRDQAAQDLATALTRVDEAQQLAGKLDPAANSKAGEALEAVRSGAGR